MEYHGKFGHTIGQIQHIPLTSRIEICYTSCCMETQTVAPTLTGFLGIKICIWYLGSHPHKPILYPSNYYDGSNFIILKWSGNTVEAYTTQNFLKFHQDEYHAIILNRRRSVSGNIHNILGVSIYWKVQIKPYVASESTDG